MLIFGCLRILFFFSRFAIFCFFAPCVLLCSALLDAPVLLLLLRVVLERVCAKTKYSE